MTEDVGAEQTFERRPMHNRKLEKPWVRIQLIHEIARNEMTERQLAKKYGCAPSAINAFKQRHRGDIDEVRADLENEFSGIWIADKKSRLAVYASDVERIEELEQLGREIDAALTAAKHRALRSVAEEMGHLPNRMNVSGEVTTKVSYEVVGVDPESLR
jgi:hypothetical protein